MSEGYICFRMTCFILRHGIIFQHSNLNFMEALLHAYNIVHHVPAHNIQQERQFGSATVTDLAKTCS
jgi:hypothetical protein